MFYIVFKAIEQRKEQRRINNHKTIKKTLGKAKKRKQLTKTRTKTNRPKPTKKKSKDKTLFFGVFRSIFGVLSACQISKNDFYAFRYIINNINKVSCD